MTPEHAQALDHLARFLAAYQRSGEPSAAFWAAFQAEAAPLEALASAPDADPELRACYYDIVDAAHDGFGEGAPG